MTFNLTEFFKGKIKSFDIRTNDEGIMNVEKIIAVDYEVFSSSFIQKLMQA